jgi:uncharacterized membrane protein YfcA
MNALLIIRIVLIVWTVISFIMLATDTIRHKDEIDVKKGPIFLGIGFLVDFFDTWGIGCFAPNMALFKFTKTCEDDLVPGTLNLAHTVPVSLEGILFITIVQIDPLTLALMLAASVVGAKLGANIVTKLNIQVLRYAMAIALVAVAIVSICRNAGVGPFGLIGSELALTGWKLVLACAVNLVLGALMNIGFGLYAPCLALCLLLGLQSAAAFPIMMGSCNVLMNSVVPNFIRENKYDRTCNLFVMIGGTVGVILAYILYKKAFSMKVLTYIVCGVMVITAIKYVMDARAASKAGVA